jgi:spoIIIJ-associated protein
MAASERKTSLEISAPSVGEAVARGLARLGLEPEQVEVIVLDEPRPAPAMGEARPARVRLTMRKPGGASDPELEAVREITQELLNRMRVRAGVTVRWIEPEDERETRHPLAEIEGQDLGIMVSRRGEPLSAMQYLVRMMVARKLGHPVPVIVDVEGYRQRREQQLRRMARRAAEQAVERGRTVVLEPMPANERRVIHIELRDHTGVTTESVGLGRQRKVTVIPRIGTEKKSEKIG